MKHCFGILAFLWIGMAWGFPELIRHGYVSCNTCHVSPNGGGVLTAYGRQLSAEVLSTWAASGEEKFAYGLLNLPESVAAGGDYRGLQYHRDTPSMRSGDYIWMQQEVEAAVFVSDFTFVASLGFEEQDELKESFTARRHWIAYRFNDDWSVRAGKFGRAYGLNIPDHYTVNKRGLQMDQGTETYNVEASLITPGHEVFITGVLGRPDKKELNREKGLVFRGALNFGQSLKVGASYLYGSNSRQSRHVLGPYALLGITKRLALDFETGVPLSGPTTGFMSYLKLQYEVAKGVNTYVTQEWLKTNLKNDRSLWESYGIGVQWFPRPHLELNFQYQKQKIVAAEKEFIDFASLLLHFYL